MEEVDIGIEKWRTLLERIRAYKLGVMVQNIHSLILNEAMLG